MIGKFIYLRNASGEDADFILKLRLDERLNKYLSRADDNLEEEKFSGRMTSLWKLFHHRISRSLKENLEDGFLLEML